MTRPDHLSVNWPKLARYWPNPRSRTTHAYVTGPGAGDTSVCGVPMAGDAKASMHRQDPQCRKCSRQAGL